VGYESPRIGLALPITPFLGDFLAAEDSTTMIVSERLSLGEYKKHVEMSRDTERTSDSGAQGIPEIDGPVTKFRSRPSKIRIAWKRKDDL